MQQTSNQSRLPPSQNTRHQTFMPFSLFSTCRGKKEFFFQAFFSPSSVVAASFAVVLSQRAFPVCSKSPLAQCSSREEEKEKVFFSLGEREEEGNREAIPTSISGSSLSLPPPLVRLQARLGMHELSESFHTLSLPPHHA